MHRKAKPSPTRPRAGAPLLAALARSQEAARAKAERGPSSRVLAVRLPVALHDAVTAEAEAQGLPVAELVRVILAAGLEEIRGGRP